MGDPSTGTGETCDGHAEVTNICASHVHEDELPPMTDGQYAKWFALSFISGGVGCRMGPAVGPDGELTGKLGRTDPLPANYRPLSEVIAEWRADPEKAEMMDRYRDEARAYFRDHPIVIREIKWKR